MRFDAAILHMAIGDCYVRLSLKSYGIDTSIRKLLSINDARFIYGGLRGMAMCNLKPSDDTIKSLSNNKS